MDFARDLNFIITVPDISAASEIIDKRSYREFFGVVVR